MSMLPFDSHRRLGLALDSGEFIPAENIPAPSVEPVAQGVGTPEFESWWAHHGQFIRAGGGDYEKCFAFSAWCAASAEPVAWRDHVEHRLRTWRQRTINRSGDRLALDDYMDADTMDDLIDFVCDEWAEPKKTDCGEAGHAEGRCGNASCMRVTPRSTINRRAPMADMLCDDIKTLRDALAAGPTPGPWVALPEEEGVKYIRIRGTRLGTKYKIANALLPAYNNPPAFDKKEARANAALIAACHPERIARLLDEIARLRAALAAQQKPAPMRDDFPDDYEV